MPETIPVRFVVPGHPIPKARHRVNLTGGKPISYTPRKVRQFEEGVGWAAKAAHVRPMPGPLAVEIDSYVLPRGPKELVADVDNLGKSVLDGLNGIAWEDDRQVVELRVRRHKVAAKAEERTEIRITTAIMEETGAL